ncbi:MAG: hypothetical protein ACYSUQ_06655 [Planctomycetota bacterium]
MLEHHPANPFEATKTRKEPHQRNIDDEDYEQDRPQTKLSRMDCEATTPLDHMSYRQTREDYRPDDGENHAPGLPPPETDITCNLRQWYGWYHVMATELV